MDTRRCVTSAFMILALVIMSMFIRGWSAHALDISDDPVDTRVLAAPPIIMFVLDDSGSMDWEVMIQGTTDGKFYVPEGSHQLISYIYDNPGDNVYTSGENSYKLEGAQRLYWQSQWSGVNPMFYNPQVSYTPWPNMSNANTSTPRSNPANASPTFNLGNRYYLLTQSEVAVIVDNQDAGYVETGSGWGESGASDEYDGSSRYTDAQNSYGTWTPNLTTSGTYEVYGWWDYVSTRDTNALYTVNHANGMSTMRINQTQNYSQWRLLGTYQFNAGTSGWVRVTRDSLSTGNSTSADAVKFVLQGLSAPNVDIKNAHYYTVDDNDNDRVWDAGEAVYLVNFNGGVREFYWVNDANENGKAEAGEVISIAELPESVRPAVYDEQGIVDHYMSDAEDLQNFANWYSYSRRRELAAKAAVSSVTSNLEGVQVGFYSINSSTTRQTVLPVHLDMAASVIVDNQDSGYQESSGWSESGASNEFRGSSRYTSSNGRYATWSPNLPATATYNVYAWWDYSSSRDTNALYTINHKNGANTIRVNQRENFSQWTLLGSYEFNQGTSGNVRVTRDGSSTGTSTSADAVMFEQVGGATMNVDQTNTLLGMLYAMDSEGGTPLRLGLLNVGRYLDTDDGQTGGLGASPYFTAEEGGACQQAFTIVMTDGQWNGDSPGVGNQDGGEGSPYADGYSNTLADVAMKYYKEDLSNGLSDEVPVNSCDTATHQHMVTYTVSFGVTGSLTPQDSDGDGKEDDPCFLDPNTPVPSWPNPTAADPNKTDDLWHAAVNGRGSFHSAGNPDELLESLHTVFQNIVARLASGASVSVNGEQLGSNTVLYQALYGSAGWKGDVVAYPVNPVTGEIMREERSILWRASEELQSMHWDTDRKIITYNGTDAGIPFRYNSLTAAQQTALDSDPDVVDYLRGKEVNGFRSRTQKLGDIVHSAPILVGDTIFAGGNDGMMHAFNALTGEERFAYVPNLVFDNLKYLTHLDYQHRFFVDLTPVVQQGVQTAQGTIDMLVGGLGKGGKGYYALNVTNVDSISTGSTESSLASSMALGEYPPEGTTDDDLGYTYSRAFIVKSNDTSHPWVIIFGNGYDSVNGHAILYVMDVNGNSVAKIDTGVGGGNGLSTPSLIDVNSDYVVDYAYAGDLNGNLWKFDLTDSNAANWSSAFDDGTDPQPLLRVPGQSITSKPDVMRHCSKHGYIVVFGTGRYLGDTDRSDTSTQTIFGIWDYGDDEDNSEYLGTFSRGSTHQLSNQPDSVTLLEQTEIDSRTLYGHLLRTLSDDEATWGTAADDTNGQYPNPTNHAGWYFDLPITGERVVKDVIIRENKAVVTSTIPNTSPCSGGADSIVHEMDACSGGRLSEPQFDINNDGLIDASDLININVNGTIVAVAPTGQGFTGLLHPPVILRMPDEAREMKILSSSAGTTETIFERAERRGIYYWQEME